MDMMQITKEVEAEAHSLGFSLFGITLPAKPLFFDQYKEWLAKNHFGDMKYLSNEKSNRLREHPDLLLENSKSVIVLGYPYAPPSAPHTHNDKGVIASFALGEDYHIFIKRLHARLMDRVRDLHPGKRIDFFSAVDSSPVMEKSLAFSAGLGWIGKNGCLINPQFGSFFFVSELFTTLDLPPSTRLTQDLCGKCNLCVKSCPTQCILPDRSLNAADCIAYLTIEHKGDIDSRLRDRMGTHVFGCDICQLVCPWNQKVIKAHQANHFRDRKVDPDPELLSYLSISPDEFQSCFHDSPIRRTGYDRFLRNVIIAVGNLRLKESVPALIKTINNNTASIVQNAAIWALTQIDIRKTNEILGSLNPDKGDVSTRQEMHGN